MILLKHSVYKKLINFDWDSNHLYKYYYNKYLFINKPKTFESFINNLYNLHIKNLLPWQNNFKTNLDKCLCFSTKLFIHIYPQYLYYINHNNKIHINKNNILKYETLDIDFNNFITNNFINDNNTYKFLKNNILNNINIKSSYNINDNLKYKIYEIYKQDFIYLY